MDQIRDVQIIHLIERIGEHYRINISSRFIRPALLQLPLDKATWDLIETLTEKFEQFRYQGLHIDELYRSIAALARFVSATRREIVPTLKQRLANEVTSDRILRDMAVNTFSANLNLLAELCCDLYARIKELDKAACQKNKRPIYEQMPEYFDLDNILMNG